MALFDANSLLFLLILCLLYYFPEFFVELASTEIFCAQETRICLFGKDNCRLEATNFIFMENIGTMLRKQRELKGFSQEYVAGLVGVSTSVISKIETSKTKARFDVISNICKALDMIGTIYFPQRKDAVKKTAGSTSISTFPARNN